MKLGTFTLTWGPGPMTFASAAPSNATQFERAVEEAIAYEVPAPIAYDPVPSWKGTGLLFPGSFGVRSGRFFRF